MIRKMKTSGSPCPLDQLSIICFKRCPYLRTYLTELIRSVWLSGTIPVEWQSFKFASITIQATIDAINQIRPKNLQELTESVQDY